MMATILDARGIKLMIKLISFEIESKVTIFLDNSIGIILVSFGKEVKIPVILNFTHNYFLLTSFLSISW